MSDLSYQMIRTANQVREADEQRTGNRKKNLLLLVMHYLSEEGYVESANSLAKETNLDFTKYEVCDNVDLETVLMEYESYYYIKFQKYPRVTKKLPEDIKARYRMNMAPQNAQSGRNVAKSTATTLPRLNQSSGNRNTTAAALPGSGSTGSLTNFHERPSVGPVVSGGKSQSNGNDAGGPNGDSHFIPLVVHGRQDNAAAAAGGKAEQNGMGNAAPTRRNNKGGQIIDFRSMINQETRINTEEDSRAFDPTDRLLKPLGSYLGYNSEWRELAMTISRDIYLTNPNVRWDDIIGLDSAKRLVKEAVVYPIRYPQLFTGILSPWKGLLLYGPPGTGKTLLAKAVATECNTTFFNISASSIVSKWRGDSEKLVRVLFELARFHAPSTIFLDELDSLMSQRGSSGGGGEHEGSRRMKTELLVQMDGLAKSDDLVFLLAASNIPWELDHAMLRRLEKRILVGLPSQDARKKMFMNFLPSRSQAIDGQGLELRTSIDYDHCAELSDGYSGSDIKLVCKEAAMRVVRKIFDALESMSPDEDLHIQLERVMTSDVEAALTTTKPSAKDFAGKYDAWQKQYESV